MILLDGKKVSNEIKDEIALEVQKMKDRGEKVPASCCNYCWKRRCKYDLCFQ